MPEIPGPVDGERKYVTALFSDMSGYTAMSESLDPEEVKEITSRIFGEISSIVNEYDGFIEKFIGDAVMALFGVPKAHEDVAASLGDKARGKSDKAVECLTGAIDIFERCGLEILKNQAKEALEVLVP